MWKTEIQTRATVRVTAVAIIGGLLAQPLAQKSAAAADPPTKSKPAGSGEMVETEAKLAKLRELVRPKPGEYVTNMAKIAWERDPWEAAVRAGKEGKPVIAYGPGMVGLPCGHG